MLSRRSLFVGVAALAASRVNGAIASLPVWLPNPTINGAGLDKVSIDIPHQFALPRGDAIWIRPDGSDDLNGTIDEPLQTLQSVFNLPNPIVCCFPGRYAPASLYGREKYILAPFGGAFIASDGGVLVNEGGKLTIGGGVILERVGIVARPWRGHRPITILRGCSILSAYGNGLSSAGGIAFSSNVKIQSSQYDAFNYGCDDDGHANFAIEYNCHASNAGDVSTFGRLLPSGSLRDNLNGSSSHSSTIVRYGGLYETSLGSDIADTWDPKHPDQISVNYGVMTRSSQIGIGYLFAGGQDQPTYYLNRCASELQSIDILATDGASVRCCRSDLPKVQLTTGGVVASHPG